MTVEQALYDAICSGDRETVRREVTEWLESGGPVGELLDGSMIPAMREMGRRFSEGEAFVPDMLIAARAMQVGLDLIEPALVESGHRRPGKVCIGTVKGDLHDIGKNLVAMMLKGAGYEVLDLGTNCDISRFEKAVGDGAQVVLCSALLTTTMTYMKEIVEHFPSVPVVVGGAPLSSEYARQIGARGFGGDAAEAVRVVDSILASGGAE